MLFFDLKEAFNGISHRVVAWELTACGFARTLISWVLSFLDGHIVTVVIDGKRTATFRCRGKSTPQGSVLSIIVFLLSMNRLLRHLAAINVVLSWHSGFVDDVNVSTASKSILTNMRNLELVGRVAKE
jgi:hypothetical protein